MELNVNTFIELNVNPLIELNVNPFIELKVLGIRINILLTHARRCLL